MAFSFSLRDLIILERKPWLRIGCFVAKIIEGLNSGRVVSQDFKQAVEKRNWVLKSAYKRCIVHPNSTPS
jgi:hypothetical protein